MHRQVQWVGQRYLQASGGEIDDTGHQPQRTLQFDSRQHPEEFRSRMWKGQTGNFAHPSRLLETALRQLDPIRLELDGLHPYRNSVQFERLVRPRVPETECLTLCLV